MPDYYPLGGGLDLLTPAIAMPPGRAISAQNYEPQISGGYRRVDGYERYEGSAAPSAQTYWIATVNIVSGGPIFVDDLITGDTSGAQVKVIAVTDEYIVIWRTNPLGFWPFIDGEPIVRPGAPMLVATIDSPTESSAATSSDHADYTALAADARRPSIQPVPGSGPVRGVWYYDGFWYAFRDNVGATAGDMYKATTTGWSQVAFGKELQFSSTTGGTTPIAVGATIGNAAIATKTATVVRVLTRTGTWGTDAVGTLIITPTLGVWSNAEDIYVGATKKAVSTSAATTITRLQGGRLDFCNANFTGSTATKRMYGADSVNLAFEFDGTNYIPIRTGMTADTPRHIVAHRNYLYLSFLGSVQNSALANPYSWTAVLGAGEIATGEYVTGFLVQSGGTSTASLAVFTEGVSYILYGTPGVTGYQMVPSADDIGAFEFCAQSIGNDSMLLSNRGIQRLKTTLNYGNFEYASVSHLIQPLITAKRGLQSCSTTLKTRNQYRVFFTDNTAITVGLTGDKINGMLPLDYGIPVRCVCTAETTDGSEVTMFGSDENDDGDAYVYQDSIGTSFDGEAITSWLRLPFNNEKAPRVRKHYRSAILELVADGFTRMDVTYDLGYGNLDVAQGIAQLGAQLLAAGGFWEELTWDHFTWDAQAVNNPRISLDGSEKNISMLFYSSRVQDNAHTLQGVTIVSTPLRLER